MTIDEELWNQLESEHRDVPGLVRRRVCEHSERDLFIGMTLPAHTRVLVLSVEAAAAHGLVDLPETRALRTTVEEGVDDQHVDVRVALIAPEMARVFTPFVEDVLESVAPTSTDVAAITALVSRFGYWKNLLSGSGSEGLDRSEQQGLFGELWCLLHVLMPELGPAAVGAWTGPDRDDRDFQLDDIGIEVKTTIRDNPPTVSISSERQLESDPYSHLFLFALSLDALPAGTGQTLNALVEAVLAAANDDVARLALRDKLIQYGYLNLHRPSYEATRYTLRQVWRFEVRGEFPRITEQIIPEGVGQVRYRLSLDACRDYSVDATELANCLRGAGQRP